MRKNNNRSKSQTPMAETRNSKKSGTSRSGNSRSKHSKSLKSREDAGLDSKGRDNDPNWYFNSAELAEQASQLSFQAFLGDSNILSSYNVPTVNVVALNPCPGNSYGVLNVHNGPYTDALPDVNSTGLNSGINLMAAKIYTMLSTYSGRSSQYTPDDVGIMLLSVAAMAEMSEYIRRAFGVMLTYNDRNRYVPLGLLKAMGFNAQDLLQNIANYRMRFNIAINRINQIPLLDNIGFIKKSRDLYQKIYLDAPSSMAQLYLYVPNSTWVLDETAYADGSRLITTEVYKTDDLTSPFVVGKDKAVQRTMGEYLDILERQIDALLSSSTLNIIYADLINLASKTSVPIWKFDYLAENYVVIPEYNRNFLLQFHNLDIIGTPAVWTGSGVNFGVKTVNGYKFTVSNDVFCDVNTTKVIYNPGFAQISSEVVSSVTFYKGIYPLTALVDMDVDAPTTEDRIEALRFKSLPSGYAVKGLTATASYHEAFRALPDHYGVKMVIFDGNHDYIVQHSYIAHMQSDVTADYFKFIAKLSQCDWAPIFFKGLWDIYQQYTDTTDDETLVVGDLNFWTEIGYSYLARLNKLIYTGLFDFRV